MRSNLVFNVRDIPFQPNHITVTVGGDTNNPSFVFEINPGTVPNYRIECQMTRVQLAGIHAIVEKFLKDGTS